MSNWGHSRLMVWSADGHQPVAHRQMFMRRLEGCRDVIKIFDPRKNYALLQELGSAPGQLKQPNGMDVDHTTNTLLVADSGNHRVQFFDLI